MPSITPRYNPKKRTTQSFDQKLRRFKKACDNAGIVQEVRDRQYYEKPNQKKHSKNQEIKRRRTIEQKKAQQKGYRHPLFR